MKNQLLLSFIFLILTLPNIIISQSTTPSLCDTPQDCFDCSGTLLKTIGDINEFCEWEDGSCIEGNNKDPFDPRYNQYSKCSDPQSEQLRIQYCGFSQFTAGDDEDTSISLPQVSNAYGRSNILCIYDYINEDEDASIYITIKLKQGLIRELNILLEAFFFEGSSSSKYLDSENFLVMVEKCRELNIYYWSNRSFLELPFTISIRVQKPGISITLIITIVLIVAACLICSVSIWIFSRKIARRNALAAQNMGNMYVGGIRVHPGETEEIVKKRKMKQLQGLLSTVLVGKKFNKEMSQYNLNCTICFDEYNSSSNVCLTECKHVFHYDCLKSWLTKNLLNPKCPNCNTLLLPDVNNGEGGAAGGGNSAVQVQNEEVQSIPFSSTDRMNNQVRSNRNLNMVNNNFVEGNGGGMRVGNNNSSTRVIMPMNNNIISHNN